MRREDLTAQLETEWQDRLARLAASDKSIAAFCRSEGVTEGTFYGWRSRLGLKGAKALPPQEIEAKMSPPFIELGPITPVAKNNDASTVNKNNLNAEQLSSLELRLELVSGVVLQITRR
ncbi:MAG: helix-turn-helix domain-containing protein [Pseudomonadota bacterium]